MSEDSDGNEWDLLLPPDDLELDSVPGSPPGDNDDPSAPLALHLCWKQRLQEVSSPVIHLDSLHSWPHKESAKQSQLVRQCCRGMCLLLRLLCANASSIYHGNLWTHIWDTVFVCKPWLSPAAGPAVDLCAAGRHSYLGGAPHAFAANAALLCPCSLHTPVHKLLMPCYIHVPHCVTYL